MEASGTGGPIAGHQVMGAVVVIRRTSFSKSQRQDLDPCLPPPSTIQFSSVQSLSRVRLFVTPWILARQASLSITNSRSLLKLMPIELVMPKYSTYSNHLNLWTWGGESLDNSIYGVFCAGPPEAHLAAYERRQLPCLSQLLI